MAASPPTAARRRRAARKERGVRGVWEVKGVGLVVCVRVALDRADGIVCLREGWAS
ncbi:hypothetical protein Slala03_28840 [Streptomyces lavendulae subsp. lavendulae]|nr:hypothetical protein Slala03_28840 [Streptomyces lavendulae subsp. lavendulae]GLX34121.1 hypothetical protein Sros01_01940 [Streptomyces roseochromogenus]